MEVIKTEDSAGLSGFNSFPAQAELDYWERLIFSFDMDREPTNSSGSNNARRSRSTTQTPTAAAGSNDSSRVWPLSIFIIFFRAADLA
jgi:hypothetical protein